ncbi:Uncharacterized protein Rs2_45743 [Raphanus sativus]|nr:Uncharacterized protein Rs2_45743 [Raphanus sativus]
MGSSSTRVSCGCGYKVSSIGEASGAGLTKRPEAVKKEVSSDRRLLMKVECFILRLLFPNRILCRRLKFGSLLKYSILMGDMSSNIEERMEFCVDSTVSVESDHIFDEQREKILRTLLSKEKTDDLDFHELWQMTEGYSGSDLKDLCITGSYRHFRELIQQEILKDKLKGVEDPLLFSLLIRLSTDFDI